MSVSFNLVESFNNNRFASKMINKDVQGPFIPTKFGTKKDKESLLSHKSSKFNENFGIQEDTDEEDCVIEDTIQSNVEGNSMMNTLYTEECTTMPLKQSLAHSIFNETHDILPNTNSNDIINDEPRVLKVKAQFTSHFNQKFSAIRVLDRISHIDMINSLALDLNRSAIFQAGQSSGKSGSFFFFSSDNRYIIKTINPSEKL